MAKTLDRTGRAERAKSHSGRTRLAHPIKVYRHKASPLDPGDYSFDLALLRGRGVPALSLNKVAESFEWRDEEAVLAGSINLRRPDPDDPKSLPIGRGHRVRCRVWWQNAWYELWQMRCGDPELDKGEGTLTVTLTDDLDLLQRDKRDWFFRKDKAHPHGWFAHQIAAVVAKRTGLKLGSIAKGTKRIIKLEKKDAYALDVIRAAYEKERDETGRRFVIRFRNGRLDVRPFDRSPTLFIFDRQLEGVTITRTGKARPFTVIEAKAKIGKGTDAKKIELTYSNPSIVARYGRVVEEKSYGRVTDRAALRRKVKRDYAKELKSKPSATFNLPGVPWLRRGDACQLAMPEEGFEGEGAILFCSRVAHSVDAGGYTTEGELAADDPFESYREELEKKERAAKRKARKKKRR